jgi:hypothetical protein
MKLCIYDAGAIGGRQMETDTPSPSIDVLTALLGELDRDVRGMQPQ